MFFSRLVESCGTRPFLAIIQYFVTFVFTTYSASGPAFLEDLQLLAPPLYRSGRCPLSEVLKLILLANPHKATAVGLAQISLVLTGAWAAQCSPFEPRWRLSINKWFSQNLVHFLSLFVSFSRVSSLEFHATTPPERGITRTRRRKYVRNQPSLSTYMP